MIGCVIAMDSEAEVLLAQMCVESVSTVFGKTVHRGKIFQKDALVVVSGEGKGNAAAGACAAICAGADLVLNLGVAGGLNDSCEVGGAYLIEKAVQYDFDLRQLTGQEVGTLPGERENFLPLCCPEGLSLPRRALGTGDRFDDSEADHALLLRLGCDIREMEAGAMAQVCRNAGVSFVSVKTVSDVYGSGATTEQFRKNLKYALFELGAHLPEIFAALG